MIRYWTPKWTDDETITWAPEYDVDFDEPEPEWVQRDEDYVRRIVEAPKVALDTSSFFIRSLLRTRSPFLFLPLQSESLFCACGGEPSVRDGMKKGFLGGGGGRLHSVATMVFGAIAIIALFVALHSAVPFANANGIGTINSDAGKFVISVYITLATAFIIYLLCLLNPTITKMFVCERACSSSNCQVSQNNRWAFFRRPRIPETARKPESNLQHPSLPPRPPLCIAFSGRRFTGVSHPCPMSVPSRRRARRSSSCATRCASWSRSRCPRVLARNGDALERRLRFGGTARGHGGSGTTGAGASFSLCAHAARTARRRSDLALCAAVACLDARAPV